MCVRALDGSAKHREPEHVQHLRVDMVVLCCAAKVV